MNLEYFDRFIIQTYEAKLINEGLKEIENNKILDGQEVIEELKIKYNF